MKQCYHDILNHCGNPVWFDECGVPRYLPFAPTEVNCIYAREVALLKIKCQACGTEFIAAKVWSGMDSVRNLSEKTHIFYGDPPNIGCCSSGPTMTSETVQVIEFWGQENFEWVRRRDLEDRFNSRLSIRKP